MPVFREKWFVLLLAVLLALSLAASPVLAAAEVDAPESYSADAMLADAVFLRPLGLVATIFGGALYVVTLPFSIPSGNNAEFAEKLVSDPFRYTFARPLGQL